MQEDAQRALRVLTGKIVQSTQPDEALKLSQACANMIHVLNFLHQTEKKKAGA